MPLFRSDVNKHQEAIVGQLPFMLSVGRGFYFQNAFD